MTMTSFLPIFLLTIGVGLAATLLCIPFALWLGYGLARNRLPAAPILRALIAVPMVMPPVAVGLSLLWLLGKTSPLAPALSALGLDIVFTPAAAVIAAAIVGFPLLARSAEQSFADVDPRYEELARTLGRSPLAAFFEVSIPLARRGLLYGALLCFTRALGEFGATAVVAGIIPGRTETLSLAIWSRLQLGDDSEAGGLVLISFLIALLSMLAAERWLGRRVS